MNQHEFGRILSDVDMFLREKWLKDRWYKFCEQHEMTTTWATGVYYLMQKFYQLPEGLRHYHTWCGHIYDCLKELDEYRLHNPAGDDTYWFELEYSLVMHDIFYIAGISANESKSGALANLLLFGTKMSDSAALCGAIINDTAMALPPNNYTTFPISRVVCDIDLVGLGKSYEEFLHNGELVRKEFHFASDEDFDKGRKDFFENLYARGYVYRLPYFKELYEDQARENIMLYISNGRLVPNK
jgi:predicted metal-dependent HD superfamily phosphohydrolase